MQQMGGRSTIGKSSMMKQNAIRSQAKCCITAAHIKMLLHLTPNPLLLPYNQPPFARYCNCMILFSSVVRNKTRPRQNAIWVSCDGEMLRLTAMYKLGANNPWNFTERDGDELEGTLIRKHEWESTTKKASNR